MNQGEMNPQLRIDYSKTTPIKCTECGGDVFRSAMKFRKLSKLLTGTPEDVLIPIEVAVCDSCNTVLEEILPDEVKTK